MRIDASVLSVVIGLSFVVNGQECPFSGGRNGQECPFSGGSGQFVVKPTDRLLFTGDSITEMLWPGWTAFVETYLVQCAGCADTQFMNVGVGGWCTYNYQKYRAAMTEWWKPTAVNVMFGNNDAWEGEKWEGIFRTNVTDIVRWHKERGARCLVSSPTSCNPWKFEPMRGWTKDTIYDSMKRYGRISMEVAKAEGQAGLFFTDQFHEGMVKAHDTFGPDYRLTADTWHLMSGTDFLLATFYIKALVPAGYDLGTLEMDYANGSAKGGEFHVVEKVEKVKGKGEGEGVMATFMSSRYPFAIDAIGAHKQKPDVVKQGLAGQMVEITDFFQTSDRLTLKVKNLPAGEYDVTWGKVTQRVSSETLAKGANLSEIFPVTPFQDASRKLFGEIRSRQMRDQAIARMLRQVADLQEKGLDCAEGVAIIDKALYAKHADWVKESHASFKPAEHTIKIVPAKK